jgi:hypothetical protein
MNFAGTEEIVTSYIGNLCIWEALHLAVIELIIGIPV